MTMVNSTITNTPANRNGVSLRKTNKPLMEKRRRARINDSLSQLKSLVIHSSKKDSSQFSKLEKADILELTVKHLRGLQAQQQQQQIQQHQLSSMPSNGAPPETFVNGKYRAGFAECAGEVIRYLDQSQGLNPETKTKVISHLASCLQIVSSSTPSSTTQQQQQQQQPSQHLNHPPHQPQQHLSKVVPQPISTSTPLPQLQSNNAAAILAAAAAAAAVNNHTSTATTTTQLPNGQIIQIVSNGNNLQNNIQPQAIVSLPQNQNIPGLTHTATQSHNTSVALKQEPSSSSITVATNTSMPSSTQPAYIHYAQPLHIQIPPIVSPVLINKKHLQRQPLPLQIQPEPKQFVEQSKEQTKNYQPPPPSSIPDQSTKDLVTSSTNLSTSTSSNIQSNPQRLSTSPPSLYPGHPKARAQKQLNFFSQDFNKIDDKFSSSRFAKNDLTPPPSSASSSSSESENTSPLNLSQSPPFPVYKVHKRHHPYSNNLEDKFMNTNTINRSANLLTENHNRLHSNIQSTMHHPMSVIVDSRNKCSDFNSGKYWSMMEEDRHCSIRHQSTPSPASSVGEERLWRPW